MHETLGKNLADNEAHKDHVGFVVVDFGSDSIYDDPASSFCGTIHDVVMEHQDALLSGTLYYATASS